MDSAIILILASIASLIYFLVPSVYFGRLFRFDPLTFLFCYLSSCSILSVIFFNRLFLIYLGVFNFFLFCVSLFFLIRERVFRSGKINFFHNPKHVYFFIIASGYSIFQIGSELHVWDDFSHWGYAAKNIFLLLEARDLLDSGYAEYPLGSAILIYNLNQIVYFIFGIPPEGRLIAGQGVFVILLSFLLFERVLIGSRVLINSLMVGLIIFLLLSISVHSLRTLMVDGLLALTLSLGLLVASSDDRTLQSRAILVVVPLFLVTLKSSGLFLAFAVLLVDGLVAMRRERFWHLGLRLGLTFFMCVLTQDLWSQFVTGAGLTVTRSNSLAIGDLGFESRFVEFVVSVLERSFLPVSLSSGSFQGEGLGFLVICGVLLANFKGRSILFIFAMTSLLMLYSIGMAFSYWVKFSEVDQASIHSFHRYWAVALCPFILVSLRWICSSDHRIKGIYWAFFLMAVVSITDLKSIGYFSTVQKIDYREELATALNEYKKVATNGVIVDFSCDSGLLSIIMRFDNPEMNSVGQTGCALHGKPLHPVSYPVLYRLRTTADDLSDYEVLYKTKGFAVIGPKRCTHFPCQ